MIEIMIFPVIKISVLGRSYCFSAEYKYAKFRAKTTVLNFVSRVPSGVSWVLCHRVIVPSWVFHASKIFSRGYFVDPRFFLAGILSVQNFLLWVFLFSPVDRMRKSGIEIYLKLHFSIPNLFQQLRMVLILERYLIY